MGGLKVAPEFDPTADLVLFQGDCLDLLPQIPAVPVKVILIDVDKPA